MIGITCSQPNWTLFSFSSRAKNLLAFPAKLTSHRRPIVRFKTSLQSQKLNRFWFQRHVARFYWLTAAVTPFFVLREIWTVPALPISSLYTNLPPHFQIHLFISAYSLLSQTPTILQLRLWRSSHSLLFFFRFHLQTLTLNLVSSLGSVSPSSSFAFI